MLYRLFSLLNNRLDPLDSNNSEELESVKSNTGIFASKMLEEIISKNNKENLKQSIFVIVISFLALCGKFTVLFPLLDNLFSANHRVLLFSQSTVVLDIIQSLVKYDNLRIDGSVAPEVREKICQQFTKYYFNIYIFLVLTFLFFS